MAAQVFIYQPSGFDPSADYNPEIAKKLKQGKIPGGVVDSFLKNGWEQSLKSPSTNAPTLYLLATITMAKAVFVELQTYTIEHHKKFYDKMVESGQVERYNDRLEFFEVFVKNLQGESGWAQLTEYHGPLDFGEVVIDMSPAKAIYKFVTLPLIYGIWPAEEEWEAVTLGREQQKAKSTSDATYGLHLWNQLKISPERAASVFNGAISTLSANIDQNKLQGFIHVGVRDEVEKFFDNTKDKLKDWYDKVEKETWAAVEVTKKKGGKVVLAWAAGIGIAAGLIYVFSKKREGDAQA